ncbi:glycosyl transferase [Caulobacter sp. AP07]|uniref:glycosyltransferase family 2 protein n=1 Tax=Caulobacter sp. AP07 TaxID=1144304 RepID=UPI000271F266|nr:glycosyltransferase family 2 protein [Caulobacter sp. AP07]EJL34064.1 glycosyl transferase [Caulobacter sp. AP07]
MSSPIPEATIIVTVHNYVDCVAAAIDSALAQTPPCQVIVIDDGSTDGSTEVVQAYADRCEVVIKPNGGQASAFNEGFRRSRGRYVFFLDADDLFLPGKVERVLRLYGEHAVGWAHHAMSLAGPDLTPQAGDARNPANLRSGVYDLREAARTGRFPVKLPATSGLSFDRECLARIMPMPEAPGIMMNESYLKFGCWALAPGYLLDEPLGVQVVHGGNLFTGRGAPVKVQSYAYLGRELYANIPGARGLAVRFAEVAASDPKALSASSGAQAMLGQFRNGLTTGERAMFTLRTALKRLRRAATAG